jgi:hypothetical protein
VGKGARSARAHPHHLNDGHACDRWLGAAAGSGPTRLQPDRNIAWLRRLFVINNGGETMKLTLICAAAVLALASAAPAQAKGCLKGALIGATAGHYAGHHGVLGAAAGCVIGRHEANKRARMERQRVAPDRRNSI